VLDRFTIAATIVMRGIMDDRFQAGGVVDVKPVTVVADDDDLVALWCPLGTSTMHSVPIAPALPRPWKADECELVASTWRWRNALLLHYPGERWSVWVTWSAAWEFTGWYVNLQSLLCRTTIGFDVRDHQLDVLVAPDRSWAWKDEVDLRRAIELGQFTADEAASIRRDGEAAIAVLAANGPAFSEVWTAWRPPRAWKIPDSILPWDFGH
jgi:predicted RNA-binding protein associated with RNAse of E/G family